MHEAPGGNVSTNTPTAFGGGDAQAAREVAHAANRVSLRISTPGLTEIRAIEYNRSAISITVAPASSTSASSWCRNIASHRQSSCSTPALGGATYAQPPKGGIPAGVPAARQPVALRRSAATLPAIVGRTAPNGMLAGRFQRQVRSLEDRNAARDPRPGVQRGGRAVGAARDCYKL